MNVIVLFAQCFLFALCIQSRTSKEEGIESLVKLRDHLREEKHRLNEEERVRLVEKLCTIETEYSFTI